MQNGYLSIVKYLVECGADIDRPIHDGNSVAPMRDLNAGATPVFIAAYRGYIDIVAFLIKNKANLETPNSKGCPFSLVSSHAWFTGNTPFFICCQHCRLDIAAMLVCTWKWYGIVVQCQADQGVNLEPVNEAGSTPFFFACQVRLA